LAREPLSEQEITKRLEKIAKVFRTPDEHLESLERAGGTGAGDLEFALGKLLTEQELSIATALITKASFVLVPPGYQFPHVDIDGLLKELTETLREINWGDSGSNAAVSNPARQPILISALGELLQQAGRRGDMRPESIIAIASFLTAYLNALDRQLRD
jgi:hypothetical protein